MQITIRKGLTTETAAATTANHHHFGAAGTWSRLALEHDCIGLAASSHRFYPNPESTVAGAVSGGPLSIAIPAGEQPPFVFDAGHLEQLVREDDLVLAVALGLEPGTARQHLQKLALDHRQLGAQLLGSQDHAPVGSCLRWRSKGPPEL